MITPSFGLTATERVLPRMALDFTTATLDPRVTFTRTGNTATVVNSSGFVAPINADLPRFDFNPTTLACNGLLIEESRTNLFTYSEDFSNPSWIKSNVTVTANATVSPSNVANASKIVEAATTGTHFFEKVVVVTTGTSYTWSGFFKAGERPSVSLIVFTNVNHTATFNLSTGTAVAPNNATSTITNFGNGWYRCSITFTSGATGNGFFDTYINNGSTTSYVGNGTSGIFAWGAQLETGAFGTSYIPTVASQVTRNADVATMTGTNFSSWYNASAGTFTSQYSSFAKTGFPDVLNASDGTNANRFQVYMDATNGFTPTREVVLSVQQGLASYNVTMGATSKGSFAYSAAGVATAGNGGATSVGNNVTHPAGINKLSLGCSPLGNVSFLNGYLAKFAFYPQRLTSTEIQAFSK